MQSSPRFSPRRCWGTFWESEILKLTCRNFSKIFIQHIKDDVKPKKLDQSPVMPHLYQNSLDSMWSLRQSINVQHASWILMILLRNAGLMGGTWNFEVGRKNFISSSLQLIKIKTQIFYFCRILITFPCSEYVYLDVSSF